MKIIITGCAGFIGSHLCESLLLRGDEVYGIDIMNDYYDVKQKEYNLNILYKFKNFIFRKEDLVTTKLISEIKPDVVVNIGAMAGVRNSIENPDIYIRTNVNGQLHLLDECVNNNVKLFVFASSSSIYGLNTKIPFNESDETENLNSPYAITKKTGEMFAKLYNKLYGLKCIGLRFFTVYGPRCRPDMAPYKFLNSIMNDKMIDKYGDGNTLRDYTYVNDIVSGIIYAIENKNNDSYEIYNLGNNNPVSLNEFIETCENVTGKKAIINQKPEQLGDVPVTYADITKAQKNLHYNPQTKLKDGIKKTYEWLCEYKLKTNIS